MKKVISIFLLAAIVSCADLPDLSAEISVLSYYRGYIDGANAALEMVSNGTYTYDSLINKMAADSAAFALIIENAMK